MELVSEQYFSIFNFSDIQLVSHLSRLAQNGSLLSYVQSSSYSLMSVFWGDL